MAVKINRTCAICGEKYSFCNTCDGKDRGKPSWMNVFHDENCRKIYYACSNYEVGKYTTKEEAKETLEQLDLSRKDDASFNPVVKEWIEDILDIKE